MTHSTRPRIALVYPHFRTRAATEMLFTPLGVASLAAQLHELGLEARVFDCTFGSFDQIEKEILEYNPVVVGIYCMISLSRNAFRLAEKLREDLPDCLLATGGPLPTLYPDHFSDPFEAVFRGEADTSFPSFCRDLLQLDGPRRTAFTELPLSKYPGLYIRREGLKIDNKAVHHNEAEIDRFPLPYRGDFNHAAYQEAGMQKDGRKTTSIITTYGCPYDCDFCSKPVFGRLFRRRNLDGVLEEIEQIHQLGYDHLWIADDSMTLDPEYLKSFCERMDGREMTWSCLSRVNGIDRETALKMQAGGCRRVYLGLETGCQDTLKLMNKKTTVEAGKRAVYCFKEAGVEVAVFLMVGYPGETKESIESTFRMALELPLDEISFNVPFPLPGSKLFEQVVGLDQNLDWDKENEVTFVFNSEFEESWLRRRIEETMKEFEGKRRNIYK